MLERCHSVCLISNSIVKTNRPGCIVLGFFFSCSKKTPNPVSRRSFPKSRRDDKELYLNYSISPSHQPVLLMRTEVQSNSFRWEPSNDGLDQPFPFTPL